jgi:hypothetical protein
MQLLTINLVVKLCVTHLRHLTYKKGRLAGGTQLLAYTLLILTSLHLGPRTWSGYPMPWAIYWVTSLN